MVFDKPFAFGLLSSVFRIEWFEKDNSKKGIVNLKTKEEKKDYKRADCAIYKKVVVAFTFLKISRVFILAN